MAAKKKTTKTAPPRPFRAMVAIRVLQEDSDRLDALAARVPVASRHAIARECLRIGLAILEREPGRLIGGGAKRERPQRASG